MVSIEIDELSGYDRSGIYEFLAEQNDTTYEIRISKYIIEEWDDYYMFETYANAAYAGQLLFEIADRFQFSFVPETQELPFVFILKTNKTGKLTELLYSFVQFFCDHDDLELITTFQEDAIEFYFDAFDHIDKFHSAEGLGCYGHLCVARIYV